MKRSVINVNLTPTSKRVRVRLEADASPERGEVAQYQKFHLLQTVLNEPSLVSCDLEPFSTLRMYYAGDCWRLEAEAIIESSGG